MRRRWIGTALTLGLTLALIGPLAVTLSPEPTAAAPAGASAANSPTARADRPNVLVILTDDQRAGTLIGMPTVMEEIVGAGTTYPNSFVPTSWCCPSRASLMSGKFSHNSGVWENSISSAWGAWTAFANGGEEKDTLATRLHDAGYRTGLFGKYLNDTTAAGTDYTPPGWDEWTAFLNGSYLRYRLSTDKGKIPDSRRYLTDVLADRTIDFIESTPKDTPFFAYFAPFAPHYPFEPGPYAGATSRAGLLDDLRAATNFPSPATNQADMSEYPEWMGKLEATEMWGMKERGVQPGPLTIDDVIERQADTLMGVDAAIARMIATLRESGELDNTLIVIASDNGYAWGEHRLQGKNTPYDVSVRVPLAMRLDGVFEPGVQDQRVVAANVDLHATILDVVGVKPGRIDGESVLTSDREGVVMEAMRWVGWRGRPAYCGYRTENRLYVRYVTGEEELYDYDVDPFELTNLADDSAYAQELETLKQATRRECSPTPPGFAWDSREHRLRAPSNVNAAWNEKNRLVVTWRAPSAVGAELPSYLVYLGSRANGVPACRLESTQLTKGLLCSIGVDNPRKPTRVTVAAVRGDQISVAAPFLVPRWKPRSSR